VSAVEGRQGGQAQAFGQGHQRGIGAAQTQVGVALGQLSHPRHVSDGQHSQFELAGGDAAQERHLRCGATEFLQQMAGLGQHRWRDQEPVVGLAQQACGGDVVGVSGAGGRDQDVGVDQDHPRPKPCCR